MRANAGRSRTRSAVALKGPEHGSSASPQGQATPPPALIPSCMAFRVSMASGTKNVPKLTPSDSARGAQLPAAPPERPRSSAQPMRHRSAGHDTHGAQGCRYGGGGDQGRAAMVEACMAEGRAGRHCSACEL